MFGIKNILVFSVVISCLHFMGCGESQQTTSNQSSVDNLAALMHSNSRLAKANLKEIKDTSTGNGTHGVHSSTGYFRQTNSSHTVESKTQDDSILDKGLAQKAQNLIEESLKNFDFMASFDASIKMMGISVNMQNELMEKMKGHGFDEKFGGNKFEFERGGNGFSMTCKDLVKNPYLNFGRDQLEDIIAQNKDLILETLSGCPEIKGGEFAQCLSDLNTYMMAINQHADCSIKNLVELKKIIKEKSQIDLDKLERSVKNCTENQFKACGFEQKEIDSDKSNNYVSVTTTRTER